MRIAAVQCPPLFDDAERAIATIVDRLRWAAAEGVGLVLFPEAWLLGHSYDAAVIRARALEAPRALALLRAQVRDLRPTLVIGAFESVGRRLFNHALVIERGQIIGRYAKAHPNEPSITPGTAFPVFSTAGMRYGINICNDANHPDAAARLAEQGAALLLYPLNNLLRSQTADRWREKSLANLVARARQTGCWVASADVTGTVADHRSYGCTAIVSPSGDVVARMPEWEEGGIIADLATAQAART
ncbi:carbon-nitrogen hydrolase family protein [Sphingomonas sp. TDK1]|uniref:carbon-nitrogen hydrolase family protein n=1 Tax=Sphingomonas sp. TDK1 TaxID=453247 RepID=UPI0007D9BB23|nr:carbon-nitrogen hydrolase family protein [Sphingomonas sp. TDK1]OAN57050.1 hypothetical protein A7X12_07330 [Sphingomonas sp. TDK1]